MDKNRIDLGAPISRRSALTGFAGAGAALVAAATLPPGLASAATTPAGATTTPASIERLFARFLAAKSAADVDATMAFFSRTDTTYWDATAGFDFPNWETLKGVFGHYMPMWTSAAHSYSSNLIGSSTGAALFFTNTAAEFGHEIRGISVVDIRGGKFVRWIDYWDGRHFGIANLKGFKATPAKFPRDFGWSKPGEHASAKLTRTVSELAKALDNGDASAAAALFAVNGVLEDLTLHTEVAGPQSIAGYLKRTHGDLPYGSHARVRHVVGGDAGGAYEWTNGNGPVPRGVTALQLDSRGQIARLSSIWDGSLVDPAWLTARMAQTIES